MYWEDLLLDHQLTSTELTEWLLTTFSVPEHAVVVASEESQAPVSEETQILCEFSTIKGEFPLHVAVFTRREELDAIDSESAIVELCRRFGLRALTSDDTPNPYRMILTGPNGHRSAVHLDVDALDDDDRYVIAYVEE
ncbi:MAG: hypothetical protein ACRDJG_11165 [Actinomycetota bacterium]